MGQKIKAYKGFDKDLSCRGFKYEVGKEYEETGDIKACEKGFHACPYPLDVFSHYTPAWSRFCEVEQSGKIDDSESDKVCSSKIRIGAELDIRGLVKAAVSYVKERCTNECNAEPGKPATAGDSGAARLVIEVLPRLVIEVLPRQEERLQQDLMVCQLQEVAMLK